MKRAFFLALLLPLAAAGAPVPGLTLSGVILDGGDSLALIRVDTGRDRGFRLGDRVAPGLTLAGIEANRVWLEGDGTRRALMLAGLDGHGAAADGTAPRVVRAMPAHADAFLDPMPGISYVSDTHFIVSRDTLHAFLGSPQALSEARWLLQKDGGLFIASIKRGSAYEKVGLRVGDVLQQVNGKTLKSTDEVYALYGGLEKLEHLDLTVRRMGREEHLLYDFRP
ncbi:MAG TPA: type II secretion system protein N [Gammaproteobacteria bacterium]|jgi:general secretion pathway protein C|nr:type II secretion system protein N [Gammaproteobacteria bacterium]